MAPRYPIRRHSNLVGAARFPIQRQIPLPLSLSGEKPATPETLDQALDICFPLEPLSEEELWRESLRLFPPETRD